MEKYLFDYGVVFVFFLFGFFFVALNLFAAWLVRPVNPNPEKLSVYECGEPTIGDSWGKFNNRVWTLGIIFVVFDVEAIFLFPLAAEFKNLSFKLKELSALDAELLSVEPSAVATQEMSWLPFFEIVTFVLILLLGIIYAWVRGDLEWIKPKASPAYEPPYVPFEPEEEEEQPVVAADSHGGGHH